MKRIAKISAFVIGTTALAYFNLPVAIFALCATILALLYEKADSLIEVSFGPLKAKLERNVSEAEKLISGLRSLALAQSRAIVAAASHTGRFATKDAWIFYALKDIERGLNAIGASDKELSEMRSSLVELTLRDLGATATNGSIVPTLLNDTAVNEWKEFRSTKQLSNPDFVETWLAKHNVLGADQRAIIEAMRWISEHKDIRDEAQYMLTKEEFKLELHACDDSLPTTKL